jgi:RNA polymerase sigma-70 factor (ECF subfamily)
MVGETGAIDVERLVAEHHEAVYRYAYRLTGAVADAEDLTQQVFLVAQQKLEQLRRVDNARGWLMTILRNSFLKAHGRRQDVPATTLHINIDDLPAEAPEEKDIDRERLQEVIGELPDIFRVVLLMFYFEDRSYREIAEELELPIGTVMSRLARAKGHLRSRLFGEGVSEPRNGRKPEHETSTKHG